MSDHAPVILDIAGKRLTADDRRRERAKWFNRKREFDIGQRIGEHDARSLALPDCVHDLSR